MKPYDEDTPAPEPPAPPPVLSRVRMGLVQFGDGAQLTVGVQRILTTCRRMDARNEVIFEIELRAAEEGIEWCYGWEGEAVEALAAARALA